MLRIGDAQGKGQQNTGNDIGLIDNCPNKANIQLDAKKLPDNPLEFAGGHLDHCRVVGLRDSKVLLQYVLRISLEAGLKSHKSLKLDPG